MEAILAITNQIAEFTNQISEFMKHATSTFGSLVVHLFTEDLPVGIFFLGCILLLVVALVRRQNEDSTD